MMLRADYKPEGGKLIRVQLELEDDTIKTVKISGDFFMHPEEALEDIETALIGTPRHTVDMEAKIVSVVEKHNITLFGLTAADLAKALMKAQ